MATSNNNLNTKITSLVKYVLDIKPYHTKLLGFTSEVSFNDTLSLSLTDSQPQHTIYHQNIWGSVDIPTLAMVSDGLDISRTFIIPPTVMPRFSITDAVNYKQQPIGDDQAISNLADANSDGVPDLSYPWQGSPTFSHQLGSDIIPVRLQVTSLSIDVTTATSTTYTALITGTIYTAYPFVIGIPLNSLELRVKNGPTVIIDASTGAFTTTVTGSYNQASISSEPSLPSFTDQMLATAWLYRAGVEIWAVNDTGRYRVPFHTGSKVRVNNAFQTFGVEDDYIIDFSRSFIQFVNGKHPAPTDRIDINLLNADRLFISICDPFTQSGVQADHYDLQVSNSAPGRNTISFVNLQPGTNKAILDGVLIYPSETDGNIWRLTSNGLFSMTVQQVHPIIGPIEQTIINEPFDNGKIAFTLRSPWVEYYLSSGVNSYIAYGMLPYDDNQYDAPFDAADFWPGSDIKTMYGQSVDPLPPLHPAVVFNALGELKQRMIGGKPQFIFEFYDVPPQGSFVELKIEQTKQLNPRLQLSMHEKLVIVQLADAGGGDISIDDKVVYADNHEFNSTVVIQA